MPTFAYAGRTRAGQTVTGERRADTMDAAVAALRREQILVTRITPAKAKAEAAAKPKAAGKLGKKVAAKNLAVFTRQFSVMIDAGLPLVQCLDILGTQEEDKNFAAVILQTRTDVESGASLADAMRKHPKTFDPLFTNMIAAGEAGGILDTILKRLATYIEKAVKLQGAGEVGDDLSGRRHRDRGPWSSASSSGRSFRRSPQLFAGLGAELPLPDAHRHRDEQLAGDVRCRSCSSALGAVAYGVKAYYAHERRPPGHRRAAAEGAGTGPHPAQDRGGAVLPDAGHARSARACRFSTASRSRPGRRATRSSKTPIMLTRKSIERGDDDLGAAEGDGGLSGDGHADDRRRRGDRRARYDAREDRRLLRGRSRHWRWPAS